jgi:hypothetical protein
LTPWRRSIVMSGDVREQNEPRRQRTRRSPAGEPATVANLVKNKHDLSTWCRTCESFGAMLRHEDLLERFGSDFLVLDVDPLLRCTRCGQRNAETRVSIRERAKGMNSVELLAYVKAAGG